ncbi:hypothetical protein PUN4_680003 [Paraburkholderia unamae]|nr:hypothetical protein PUN4_680003 [Paraburkholderia unamae]
MTGQMRGQVPGETLRQMPAPRRRSVALIVSPRGLARRKERVQGIVPDEPCHSVEVCGRRAFCGLIDGDETGVLHRYAGHAVLRLRETLRTRSG